MKKLKPSAFLMDVKAELKEIIRALGDTYAYVSILGKDVVGTQYTYATSGKSVGLPMDAERGFVLRAFTKTGPIEYSFNDVDREEVVRAVKDLEKEREGFLAGHKALASGVPLDAPETLRVIRETGVLPEEDNPEEILKTLEAASDAAMAAHKELIQTHIALTTVQISKIFLSKHKDLTETYAYATAFALGAAKRADNVQIDFTATSHLGGSEILSRVPDLMMEAGRRATELLDATRVVPGEYDIICDPDFSGLIAHEAFGHGAEMDMFVKHRSKAEEFMDKRVASDLVGMHDGAAAIPEVSSYAFDDEGTVGGDTRIIENGILRSGMCDALSALHLGIAPTGNGKRESYKRKAYTRMTNTFFEGGTDTLEDMMASISHGYLLEGFSSGMEDPKNWGIQCVAAKGREIRDGKLTGKIVSPLYLTGYVPDLLKSIDAVSENVVMCGSGYCGKGWKEWVKTSTGGPYIKAKGRLS